MENKKIWHTELDLPIKYSDIVCIDKAGDRWTGFRSESGEVRSQSHGYVSWDYIEKWAYVRDLVATSKALDVAIDTLRSLQGAHDDDCGLALQDIESIMKGNK